MIMVDQPVSFDPGSIDVNDCYASMGTESLDEPASEVPGDVGHAVGWNGQCLVETVTTVRPGIQLRSKQEEQPAPVDGADRLTEGIWTTDIVAVDDDSGLCHTHEFTRAVGWESICI